MATLSFTTPAMVTLAGFCQFIVPDSALAGQAPQRRTEGRSDSPGSCMASGTPGAWDLELGCPSGVVLWGEAWGGTGVFVVDGAAAVKCEREAGAPVLDVYVQGGAEAVGGMVGMRREMRVPAVDVLAVASLDDSHPDYNTDLREHVAAMRRNRTLN